MKPLTNRQIQLGRQLLLGRTVREAAKELGIAYGTALAHRRGLFAKLRVDNMEGFLAYLRKVGLE